MQLSIIPDIALFGKFQFLFFAFNTVEQAININITNGLLEDMSLPKEIMEKSFTFEPMIDTSSPSSAVS